MWFLASIFDRGRVMHSNTFYSDLEPNAGGAHTLRFHLQLPLVRQDLNCEYTCHIQATLFSYPSKLPNHHRFFLQILFLNKIDLFAEKLPTSPLGDYFPDYNGGDNYDAACEYLLHRFVSLNQNAATKQIYAHYTCATDTQQIKCKLLIIGFLSRRRYAI